MPEKVGWWTIVSVVGSGMFGLCMYGFIMLHGLIVADRAEAA
jgi:hypothetical protein